MKSLELKRCFIEKSREKFGTKFLFNKVDYVNYHTKVIIICPTHGEMVMTPDAHIKSKYGCRACAKISAPIVKEGETSPVKTLEQFVSEAKLIHKNKYDYSTTLYKNRLSPIAIVCPLHGEFILPQAFRHLEGRGCRECYHANMFLTKETYIEQANKYHKNKYSYEAMDYKGKKFDITVTCPVHGDFTVNAERHTRGVGCKQCRSHKRLKRNLNNV